MTWFAGLRRPGEDPRRSAVARLVPPEYPDEDSPNSSACPRAGRWSDALRRRRGSGAIDERGDVTVVVGRQPSMLAIKSLPLPVVPGPAVPLAPGRRAQPGRPAVVRRDYRDGRAEPSGERVNGGRARRPDQVPRGGERVDSGPGQPRAAGDCARAPAPVLQPLMDQPLQRVMLSDERQGRNPQGAWLVVCGVVVTPINLILRRAEGSS